MESTLFLPEDNPLIQTLPRTDDDTIFMDKEQHRYYSKEYPDTEFTSATTFISYFFKPFDTIGIARSLATHNVRYAGQTPADITGKWKIDTNEGSLVHEEIEQFITNRVRPQRPKSLMAAEWLTPYCSSRYVLFPEQILFSPEHKLAGTADLIIKDTRTDTYALYDWKTNRSIAKTGYRNRKGIYPVTARMHDCQFIKYALQLTIYKYLIETYHGVTISKMGIVHLQPASVSVYTVNDMRPAFLDMLTYNRTELKENYLAGITQLTAAEEQPEI